MSISERRSSILKIINDEGSLRATELAERMNVTTETIRKDLIYLNNKNLLKKSHGEAHPLHEFIERSVDLRSQENIESKQAIANAAIQQLNNCSVIFIDAGSTLNELAKRIKAHPKLAIITNSFSAIDVLKETGNTIYFIGGEVSTITMATSGFWATDELHSIKIDIAFLGTSGFQSHAGPCTKLISDAQLKKEVINNSNKTIVLADNSKFCTNAIMQFADWEDIDLLITDSQVNNNYIEQLKNHVDILIAEQ